jgi:Holliday junction DNA helicase RuvB
MDRKILQAIAGHHGTPVGVKTIAVIVGEEEDTIEDVYEPFLIQEGYVLKTPRGRMLSGKGYEHIGLKPPKNYLPDANDPGLF